MTDIIAISFPNLPEVQAWLSGLPDALQTALQEKSQELANALQQKVQEKLSGEVLQVRTGALRDSIEKDVQETDSGVRASVFPGGDVPYAAIQEYGGMTKAHIIEAVNAKSLSFIMGGKQAFARYVLHPGSDIPARSYLGSSLDEMNNDIVGGIGDATGEAITV